VSAVPGDALLEVDHLGAGYGDLRVVWDVSLAVYAGQTSLVLGRNGAGKTTTLKACAGIVRMMGGSVRLRGEDLSRTKPYDRISTGLAYVEEGKKIFRQRTVEENLRIGGWTLRRRRKQLRVAVEQAYDIFPILKDRRHQKAGILSGGQQQMLAIAQALVASPSVLMLDEPTAGLAPSIAKELFATLDTLKRQGLGVLLVEQMVEEALAAADHVTVMEQGRSVLSGLPSEIDSSVIREIYMGGSPV
jgi:branched-chain amino acid transport system ATP-binding protein